MLDDTTGLLLRPNAPGLAPEVLDLLYEGLLPWLDAGGDEQLGYRYSSWTGTRQMPDGSCGTTACIGGWLMIRQMGVQWTVSTECRVSLTSLISWVADRLGTDWATANELCMGGSAGCFATYPTAAQAAAVVRHWLESGEVRWDLVMPGEEY